MNDNRPINRKDADFSVEEFFSTIWSGKSFILAISLIFAFATAIFSLSLNDFYTSHVIIVPAEDQQDSSSSALSGMATIAGLNIGSSPQDNKTKQAIAVLKSRKFIVDFIEKYDLEVKILAAESWNKNTNELLIDENLYDVENKKWISNQTVSDAYRVFLKKHLSVSSDILNSGLITVSVDYISPSIANEWASSLVEELNARFKNESIDEANKSIKYLNSELSKSGLNLDEKRVLYNLIQSQTNKLVLANGKDEFIFKTIDPSYIADKKTGPLRSIYVVIAFLSGVSLSVFLLFLASFNRRKILLKKNFPWVAVNEI